MQLETPVKIVSSFTMTGKVYWVYLKSIVNGIMKGA